MIDKETAAKVKDEAWCEAFITAWNAQACARAGMAERIEELEALLEETIRQLAEMTESFNMLADMMHRERIDG